MAGVRELNWDGLVNGRDLGGLPAHRGRSVRRAALARSGNVAWLRPKGWSALWGHGVRTVIDLTDPGEDGPDRAPRPPGLSTVRLPLDDSSDTEFWQRWGGPLSCTPLYYAEFLERYPERVAEVVRAVARAEPGGVLVHCGSGRDRTGLIVLVMLALVGVPAEEIAADHALSHEPLRLLAAAEGRDDDAPKIARLLAEHGRTAEEVLTSITETVDFPALLSAAGLSELDLQALRARLLDDRAGSRRSRGGPMQARRRSARRSVGFHACGCGCARGCDATRGRLAS